MTVLIQNISIGLNASIREAIACIDRNARGIALVVDSERHLLGTITDGDVRRAILAQISFDITDEQFWQVIDRYRLPHVWKTESENYVTLSMMNIRPRMPTRPVISPACRS